MRTLFVFIVFCIGNLCHHYSPCFANNGKTAYTTPISGITIDGNLDDWPEGLEEYSIDWVSPRFHKPTPPDGPEDYTANFRTGYNIDENLLYVAVVVFDDDVVVQMKNPNIRNQDVCGIYIDADNSGGDTKISGRQLYVMVPGESMWTKKQDGNPSLNQGDTKISGINGAYQINDNRIVYEWAIPLFDSFPEKRSKINPGKRIGFDFLVADADGKEMANFITWSPEASKSRTSDLYGELIFLESYDELGSFEGKIVSEPDKKPLEGLPIEVYHSDNLLEILNTSDEGKFDMKILPGEYTLRVIRGQGIKPMEDLEFEVNRNEKSELNLAAELIILPDALEQAMEQYGKLTSYSDTTTFVTGTRRSGHDNRMTEIQLVEYKKPRHLKIQNAGSMPGYGLELYYNDSSRILYHPQWKQYLQKPVLPSLETADIEYIESTIIKELLLSKNPRLEFMNGIIDIREDGTEIINGEPTIRYELDKTYSSIKSLFPVNARDYEVTFRFWLNSKDKLFVKMSYAVDMDQLLNYMEEDMRKSLNETFSGLVLTISEIHSGIRINPDLPENIFAFNPPEDSKPVRQFRRPERSEKKITELIGETAPGFELKDLKDEKVSLKELQGNVVFLDFWATWCGPCVKSMPHIQKISQKYKDKGLIVLGINSWERDARKVEPFIKEQGITYRILLDEDNKVIANYNVSGIPSFFILDRKGTIRFASSGFREDDTELMNNIENLLKE